jgi:pyridoxamine 5'-phosphate oxidase
MDKQFTSTLQNMREQYDSGILTEGDLFADPIKQFEKWFKEALEGGVSEPNAMDLCTVSNNRPSSRIVLLKGVDERGFVFYTNYDSRKGAEMESNPWISLNFFWQLLSRQVRIEGKIEKLSPEESDEYFKTRPRESQLGAWASSQSSILKSRTDLENELERYTQTYQNLEVPRPPHWGGYLVRPTRIEFWQGRISRLHDRFLYEHHHEGWMVFRLAP